MMSSYWSEIWTNLAPALGDHLWQSTLCAAAAGLLTLLLRKNHARARYWLWMVASLKFLIPFSALIALGSRLSWLHSTAAAPSRIYFALEEVSQPFTQPAITASSRVVPALPLSGLGHLLPTLLVAVWFCGFVAVLLAWCLRWRRMSVDVRSAAPLYEGREVEALRRVENVTGIRQRVKMFLSRTTLEPGIFGLRQPVLVWPEGISERLENPHLEAILAHELWHVRRRDNLAAVIHMTVEAIFWFHPLVWWLGARLIDERERACDEQVLELGGERQVYAESILKVCEFCVGSPLACVSGVTGADLKKRMVHIMSVQVVKKLDLGRKLLLSAVALLAIAAPIMFGLIHATPSRAQSQANDMGTSASVLASATIKPSQLSPETNPGAKKHMVKMMFGPEGFTADDVTLRAIMQEAYGVQANQIIGGPDWLDTATFDVETKADKPSDKGAPMEVHVAENRRTLQILLADRTKLVLHPETKEMASYALVVAEGGSKLRPVASGDAAEGKGLDGRPAGEHRMSMRVGKDNVFGVGAQGVSVDELAQLLSRHLGAPVTNKTGLQGRYNFNLNWAGANPNATGADSQAGSDHPGVSGSSFFDAVQEQLGLKLEPQTGPTEVLVIDHVEKPAGN
jgi:bla regulator protein blaR1